MKATPICSVPACDGPVDARGWCGAHYHRWQRHGDPGPAEKRPIRPDAVCDIAGCDDPHLARGWCSMHYARWRTTGSVKLLSDFEKFWRNVEFTGFCWEWKRTIDRHGYGFYGGSRAHRLAYEMLVGPIPTGLQIDHLCRVRRCVNPDHLDPVTPKGNTATGYAPSGINARKTACKRGHPFTPENTRRAADGGRSCVECKRASGRRQDAKRKELRRRARVSA